MLDLTTVLQSVFMFCCDTGSVKQKGWCCVSGVSSRDEGGLLSSVWPAALG